MTASRVTWIVLATLYGLFFGWYTSCAGPLSAEEVEHYLRLLEERAGEPDREQIAVLRTFLESDTGDDLVMWNNVDFREEPLEIDGVEPGQSAEDVLQGYMAYMWPALLARASHPVVAGRAAGRAPEMFGMEGVRDWDQGAAMRYRSRRDLMEIVTNPAFARSHGFKIAAIEKTFAFPLDPWFQLGDPRLVLGLVFLVVGLATSALRRA